MDMQPFSSPSLGSFASPIVSSAPDGPRLDHPGANRLNPPCAPSVTGGILIRESIEQVVDAIGSACNLETIQLEPGRFTSRLEYAAGRDALIYRENCPRKTFANGEILKGRFGISIPIGPQSAKLCGQDIGGNTAASALNGEEIRMLANPGYRHLVAIVNHHRLQELAESSQLPAHLVESIRTGRKGMALRFRPNAVQPLIGMLDHICLHEQTIDIPTFDQQVLESVIGALDHTEHRLGDPPSAVLFRRAIDLVESGACPPRVSALTLALKVGASTLQKAFHAVAGVSPITFFISRQLHRARHLLLTSDPATTKVSSVAIRLGVTELGRFSVRYREMFGESPSSTLRRQERPSFQIPCPARDASLHPGTSNPANTRYDTAV